MLEHRADRFQALHNPWPVPASNLDPLVICVWNTAPPSNAHFAGSSTLCEITDVENIHSFPKPAKLFAALLSVENIHNFPKPAKTFAALLSTDPLVLWNTAEEAALDDPRAGPGDHEVSPSCLQAVASQSRAR